MGKRSNLLAERLEKGAQALDIFASGLNDAQWQTRVKDGRKVGVLVHHVANMYPLEIQLAQGLSMGKPIVGVTWDAVAGMNAAHAKEFDGVVYSIWTDTQTYEPLSPKDIQQETFDLAHDRMKELADVGGGAFYECEELKDLAGAYDRVVADLGTLYTLSYRPTNKVRDGSWRTIRVNVNRPTSVARGKRGYYAK